MEGLHAPHKLPQTPQAIVGPPGPVVPFLLSGAVDGG